MSEIFVTYSRVSTSDQNTNWSKPNQVAACHAFAATKDWKPYREPDFDDTQSGAANYIDRTTLEKIVNLAKSRVITRVIINRIDRIGRNRFVLESFINDLYRENVIPVIATDGIEFPNADSFITKYIFEIAVAEYTRKVIIEGSTRGQKLAFESGAFLTTPPFGYRRIRNKGTNSGHKTSITTLEPDSQAAELVTKGLELFAETQSYRQAAIKLNFYNNNNPDAKKHSFISSSITRMVENLDLYLGLPYSKTREFVMGQPITRQFQHAAIIAQDLADRVRLADTLRNRETLNETLPKPFRRIIYCSHCGTLVKVCTKYPGNTQRANIYHYANCFSKEKNKNLVRTGMSHTLKYKTCGSEITIAKFLKHLTVFLAENTDGVFESQMQEHLADRMIETKIIHYDIQELELDRELIQDELKQHTDRYFSLSSELTPLIIIATEKKLAELENKLQEINQNLMDLRESYLKELSLLSKMGIGQKIIENIEIADDRGNMEYYERSLETLDKLRKTNPQEFEIQRRAINERVTTRDKDITKQFLNDLEPHVTEAIELIGILRKALKEQDWILLNTTMAQLGLRFTADFSEPDRIKRIQSIRLEMHGIISPTKITEVSPP